MAIKLFDIENKVAIPTEHCYTSASLKKVLDEFPKEAGKIYAYLFYMCCYDSTENPYSHLSIQEKEDVLRSELELTIDLQHPTIIQALDFCNKMYETPSSRMYDGIKSMIDRLAEYLRITPITTGIGGNLKDLKDAAKDYKSLRDAFKEAYNDVQEEAKKVRNKGDRESSYDLM